jgi:hypothetical protein
MYLVYGKWLDLLYASLYYPEDDDLRRRKACAYPSIYRCSSK